VQGVKGYVVYNCVVGCVGCCGLDFPICFLEAVNIPVTDCGVIGCSYEMARFMRIPRETISTFSAIKDSQLYPSAECPLRRMSGLQSLLVGELGCFVRSKIRTSPLTDIVAIISGF
jgi:hypothetical protein